MNFFEDLKFYLFTREGRDDLFGRSKANAHYYALRNSMYQRFIDKYPEFEVSGSLDNFYAVVQWRDGVYPRCILVHESRRLEDFIVGGISDEFERRYFSFTDPNARDIPMLLSTQMSYQDYAAKLPLGFNIVLAEVWLCQNLPNIASGEALAG